MADEKWIEYLQNSFRGNWIFSSNSSFEDWVKLPGKRIQLDTFEFNKMNQRIETLVISRHPGLRTAQEVVESGILSHIQPTKFIYDPGRTIGDLQHHLESELIFFNLGFDLKRIVVVPKLGHQYCEFEKK
jgi:hypothetical protein